VDGNEFHGGNIDWLVFKFPTVVSFLTLAVVVVAVAAVDATESAKIRPRK